MPKSKRDRAISLTVTKKKGLEFKQNLITEIRENLDTYTNLFVITMFNQRNVFLKDLRHQWSDSKFLFGKNKVISIALGRGPESEYKDDLHKISNKLKGNVGLLFTNRSKEDVLDFFEKFTCPDYARCGNVATETVTLLPGPLDQFQHTMEPQLRKLGLHTSLKKGIVHLDTEFSVCQKGQVLTADQARILKLFEYMQATFKINVKIVWNAETGTEILDDSFDDNENNDDDDDETEKDENNNNNDEEMKQVDDDDAEQDEQPKAKKLKNKSLKQKNGK